MASELTEQTKAVLGLSNQQAHALLRLEEVEAAEDIWAESETNIHLGLKSLLRTVLDTAYGIDPGTGKRRELATPRALGRVFIFCFGEVSDKRVWGMVGKIGTLVGLREGATLILSQAWRQFDSQLDAASSCVAIAQERAKQRGAYSERKEALSTAEEDALAKRREMWHRKGTTPEEVIHALGLDPQGKNAQEIMVHFWG